MRSCSQLSSARSAKVVASQTKDGSNCSRGVWRNDQGMKHGSQHPAAACRFFRLGAVKQRVGNGLDIIGGKFPLRPVSVAIEIKSGLAEDNCVS